MYVQCSPVMASFLCRNFVWVEFEDIQHCLGFPNIWQIEKTKQNKKTLQKVWPNLAAKHPEILAVASVHAQMSCRGQCFTSSTTEHHHMLCTQTTQGMLKYSYQENREYSYDGHRTGRQMWRNRSELTGHHSCLNPRNFLSSNLNTYNFSKGCITCKGRKMGVSTWVLVSADKRKCVWTILGVDDTVWGSAFDWIPP